MTINPHTPPVAVCGVSKSFGASRALLDVSLTIPRGRSRALVGRNGAGKSTLISIITGIVMPDTGTVQFADARGQSRIECVYQRSTLVPGLTAAENVMLNNYPRRLGLVDWGRTRAAGRDILAEWNCAHVADQPAEKLAPVERKIVEICRALSRNPGVLLLDEPTAGLDYAGAQHLFERVRQAQERQVSIIYVSHHLEEVFDVCDDTTVLRDGQVVLDRDLSGMNMRDLVEAMVGEAAAADEVATPPAVPPIARPSLRVSSLHIGERVKNVDLELRPGECLGLAGLEGAGHMQVAQAVCGLQAADSGVFEVGDHRIERLTVPRSIAAGIGFIPEDRHDGGYVPAMSVAENATMPIMRKLRGPFGAVRRLLREQKYRELSGEWAIKCDGPDQPVEELSGGNQQKVVLARAMSSNPSTIVLMNPTAGVDIAAKRSIYQTVKASAEKGRGVLIASADDEDFSICHRVIVMFRGKIHRELVAPFTGHELALAIQGE